MSTPFWQLVSCHRCLCNDLYHCHILWWASSSKFVYVLAVRWSTTVQSVWYYLPSAKCGRDCCWRETALLHGALTSSAHNVDMQYLTYPFTELSGSVPVFYAHAPFISSASFVVCCVLLVVVDICLLPPWYAHVAATAISTCQSLALFVPIYLVYFLLLSLAFVLVSLSPCWSASNMLLHYSVGR